MKILTMIFPSVGLFLSLSSFSIQIVTNQMIALNQKNKSLRISTILLSAIRITIITTSIASIILLLILPIYKNLFNSTFIYFPLLLTIPILYFSNLSGVFKGYLEGTSQFIHPYISNIIESSIKLLAVTILLLIFKNTSTKIKVLIIFIAYVISELSSFFYLLILMKKKKGQIRPQFKKGLEIKMLKQACPLTLTIALGSLSNYLFPFFILFLANKLNIAYENMITEYTLITSYAMPALVLLESVSTTLTKLTFPKLTQLRDNKKELKKLLTKAIYIITIASVLSFFISFYHTDILLKILYGNNIAILTVKKLAPIYLLLYFNPLLVAILQANNKEKAIFVIQIITDTLMLLLAFIFTLFFKTDGLLYGIAIYLIIRFIILLIITIKNSNITIDIIEVLSIILLSIIFILAINLTNPQYHFSLALLYLAISLLLYPNDNNKVFLYLYRKHKVSY